MAGPKPSSPLVAPSRSHRFFDRYPRVLRRALTLAGLHRMAEQGVDVVDLYVDADNTAAVALYASLGFELFAADAQYRRP